jgi:hypothetical protein
MQEMHCFYVTKKYVQRFCNHLRANAEDEEGIVRYWKYTRLLKRRMHRIADMCWAGWKAYMYVSRSEATTKLYRQELREIAELGSVSESTRQESQRMKSDFSYRDKEFSRVFPTCRDNGAHFRPERATFEDRERTAQLEDRAFPNAAKRKAKKAKNRRR